MSMYYFFRSLCGRRTLAPCTRLGAICTVLLIATSRVAAQVPFPSPALVDATSQQQAIAVLGAGQAERSGYLLLDAPDVAVPGHFRATIKSEIPGTSHLVLIRTTTTSLVSAPPQALERVTIYAKRLDPGAPATANVDIEISDPQTLTLLALARGKWFGVSREVKLGRQVGLQ